MYTTIDYFLPEFNVYLALGKDDCEVNPCENGGDCIDMDDSYVCMLVLQDQDVGRVWEMLQICDFILMLRYSKVTLNNRSKFTFNLFPLDLVFVRVISERKILE